ncbi:MAG: ATP-dependent zinc protease [Gammaproteobacteria bacterium]|nr:ATP-dependent zinc protease [Gammaproteobacteria bacterium]MBL7000320.1 ATP-dependent zinc protease [Gammaproteobacteria bacterium]
MSNNKTLGWREWIELPDLGISSIKAKVDTGARSSCLHAFELDVITRDDQEWARFKVHPLQANNEQVVSCEARILDRRQVRDSGGHSEERIVISTTLRIGEWEDKIEMTLTARDNMRFRMLMGRTSITRGGFKVDPSRSYLQGIKSLN